MISAMRQEALSQFRYLWKLDDKAWVKERKEQWRYLAEHNFIEESAKNQKKNMRFFVRGERDEYIGECIQLLLTPYDSIECIKKIFNSNIFTAYDRSLIMSQYILVASQWGHGMPWLRQHIQWFVEGVLGDEYRFIEEQENVGKRIISPEPTFWCKQYTGFAIKLLSGDISYHGCVECVGYYVSALPYADKADMRKPKKFFEMLRCIDAVLTGGEEGSVRIEFAKKLKSREGDIVAAWNKNSHLDNENSSSDVRIN